MLSKNVRKRIQNENWYSLLEKDQNKSQFLFRIKNHSQRAIDDLTLLAQQADEHTQSDLFTETRIEKFVQFLLSKPIRLLAGEHESIDSRRMRLATTIARISLEKAIQILESDVEPDEILNRANKDKLSEAIELAEAIALKAESLERSRVENLGKRTKLPKKSRSSAA